MTKLVLYIENYFPGGLERFVFDIIKSNMFEVVILVNSENRRVIEFAKFANIHFEIIELSHCKIDANSIKLFGKFIKIINFFGQYCSMLPNYYKIKKLLKNFVHYENILIINGGYPAALSTLMASVASKKLGFLNVGLSILSSPSPKYSNIFFRYFQSKIDRLVGRYIDFYIPNSNQIKFELIKNLNIQSKKIFTIYTGVDIPKNINKINELNFNKNKIFKNNNEVWLVMVALLGSTKRQDLLLKALVELDDNIKLLLVGDGPNRDFLEKESARLGIQDRVIFTGWIENPNDMYCFADIVVFASNQEGLPYSISEAMSYKIPIIASSVGGIPEQIINNENGLLFHNNVDELVGLINKLSKSKELQKTFVEYSFEKVKILFSTDSMNNKILELYKNKTE